VVVNELGPVVRIDADDRKREHSHHVLERFEDPLLCFVSHGTVHRPPGRNVRNRQGETVFTRRVAALMADQVNLHKPEDGIIPFGPGADQNLRLQQCSRLGMGPLPRHHRESFRSQPAVDRGRTHAHQQGRFRIREVQLTITAQ